MDRSSSAIAKKQKEFKTEIISHLDALHNFAFHFTSDPYDAEDLVQESVMKAYRYFDRYQNGTNGRAWVFTIMRNSFINSYRKQVKRPMKVTYDEELDPTASLVTHETDPVDRAERTLSELIDDELYLALDELPEAFRNPILLCDLGDYTYEETANMLDVPIGTVRSRLHRGRNLLKNRLLEYGKKRGYVTGCMN